MAVVLPLKIKFGYELTEIRLIQTNILNINDNISKILTQDNMEQ